MPVVAILLVLLVGMVAFAVDIGFIAAKRTSLQRTADAAALAGVSALSPAPGHAVNYVSGRDRVRQFVTLNEDLEVLEDDITFGRYDPAAPAGYTFTKTLGMNAPNAVRVRLRRDDQANGPLNLFFAPVLGRRTAAVRARRRPRSRPPTASCRTPNSCRTWSGKTTSGPPSALRSRAWTWD